MRSPKPTRSALAVRAQRLMGEGVRRLSARSARRLSPHAQRWALVAATVVFVVGGIAAVGTLGVETSQIRWWPIAVAGLVGVPANAVMTAWEYAVSARVLGHRVGLSPALRVSVVATAANLLPLPGAAIVRIQGLHQLGSGYRKATSSTALVGMFWLGIAALLAGGFLLSDGRLVTGLPFVLLGLIGLAVGYILLRVAVVDEPQSSLVVRIVGVETASIAIGAARMYLVLLGLGVPSTTGQVTVLTLSGVLASSVGIFPGGLGLREIIASALAPLVGLPPAAGFLAAGLNRLLGIVAHAPITVALASSDRSAVAAEPAGAAAADEAFSGDGVHHNDA